LLYRVTGPLVYTLKRKKKKKCYDMTFVSVEYCAIITNKA